MATMYTAPLPAKLPRHLTARVVVMRKGGGALSPADLDAAAALWPVPKAPRKAAPKGRAVKGKAPGPARRAAAKRPAPPKPAPRRRA